MVKLRFQAESMKQLSKDIIKWCDDVEQKLDTLEPHIIEGLGDRLEHDPSQCGGAGASSGCFNAAGNEQKLERSIAKLVSMPEI